MTTTRPRSAAPARASLPPLDAPLRALCPACDASVVTIAVRALVTFDVVGSVAGDSVGDLEVIAHEWQDASWDGESVATCGECGWRGTVAELGGS